MNAGRRGNGVTRAVKKVMYGESASNANAADLKSEDAMTSRTLQKEVDRLLAREDWKGLERLMRRELAEDPDNHWLLTELGSALYEQRQYAKSLEVLEKSLAVLDDCPLTIWHMAGALAALGRSSEAVAHYRRLLESVISPDDDPCWESEEWTRNLKADCLYRLGKCQKDLGQLAKAERNLRSYYELLLNGVEGSYSVEEVTKALRSLYADDSERQRQRKVNSILLDSTNGHKARTRRVAVKT